MKFYKDERLFQCRTPKLQQKMQATSDRSPPMSICSGLRTSDMEQSFSFKGIKSILFFFEDGGGGQFEPPLDAQTQT